MARPHSLPRGAGSSSGDQVPHGLTPLPPLPGRLLPHTRAPDADTIAPWRPLSPLHRHPAHLRNIIFIWD